MKTSTHHCSRTSKQQSPLQQTVKWLREQVTDSARKLRKAQKEKNSTNIRFYEKRLTELGYRILHADKQVGIVIPAL